MDGGFRVFHQDWAGELGVDGQYDSVVIRVGPPIETALTTENTQGTITLGAIKL